MDDEAFSVLMFGHLDNSKATDEDDKEEEMDDETFSELMFGQLDSGKATGENDEEKTDK